jgi:hypothetical protein
VAAGPYREKEDAMPTDKLLSISPDQRNVVGVIVTAREQETDERIVLHKSGTTTEALLAVADDLDAREGVWRILTISTPTTVYRDLQGTRLQVRHDHLERPEHWWLARINRRDLMDPSIFPADLSAAGRAGGLWGRKRGPRKRGAE